MKHRIEVKETVNGLRYYPQSYGGFFVGWYYYFAKNRFDNKSFDTEKEAIEFIDKIKSRTVLKTSYKYI